MNNVTISGRIKSRNYSHDYYGETYVNYKVLVTRLSGTEDEIPVMVSDRLLFNADINSNVIVTGEFRSCNREGKHILYLFASEIRECQKNENINFIELAGYVCREPEKRTTPLGRTITDIMIAVGRKCNRTDYIPCVAWGRNASYLNDADIGDFIELQGRIQSRVYIKDDTIHLVNEVSIRNIQIKEPIYEKEIKMV